MIRGVDSKKWIRISKIAVLLEVCCGLSAEVAGACISTGILNLVLKKKKKLCIENNDLALTISSEDRKYNEKSTEDGDMRVAVCLEVLRLPVFYPGRSRARTEGIVTMRNLSLQPITKPSMPGLAFPAPINDDVEGWPQEYGPGVDGWNRRRANLEALWLFATGDEPILGYGSPFWTKAGLSNAMAILDMIERWTNERNDDSACIIGTRLAACFWIHTKAVEIEIKAVVLGREGKESCSTTRAGTVIGSWPTMYGYLKKKKTGAPRKAKILQLLVYDIEVPGVWQWS